jgi:glycerol-3-phosphate cytidylyltransferase/D-beta-D-heptose 7-phosphate kinase/D-beta-D-heptose 1-phosphate adenosyltransferase
MKRVIVSGYFNPLHGGHLDMIEAARNLGDYLIVIVNNDAQQILKKGKVILDEMNRMRLISALKAVDEVMLAVDTDPPVIKSLRELAIKYPKDTLIFANGGDRDGHRVVPESEVCEQLGIEMVFGVGSHEVVKRDSSSRINKETGHEA